MYRFSEINYNASSQTVDVGAGLIWDDVYAALEPLGVNVVGGRVTGIGVAGFTLGGGTLSISSYKHPYSRLILSRIFLENKPIWVGGRQRCCLPARPAQWKGRSGD